jgi:hypothetical protein
VEATDRPGANSFKYGRPGRLTNGSSVRPV